MTAANMELKWNINIYIVIPYIVGVTLERDFLHTRQDLSHKTLCSRRFLFEGFRRASRDCLGEIIFCFVPRTHFSPLHSSLPVFMKLNHKLFLMSNEREDGAALVDVHRNYVATVNLLLAVEASNDGCSYAFPRR